MADLQRVSLDEIVVHFQELEDPRSTVNQRHPLTSVVVIALLAVLAGAGGPTAIARWAALKEELLSPGLALPHRAPRKDVFRRVLMVLKPAAFQACFASWLQSLRRRPRRPVWIGQCCRWTARPCGGVTIARRDWGRCIWSACGPASTVCHSGKWPATRN